MRLAAPVSPCIATMKRKRPNLLAHMRPSGVDPYSNAFTRVIFKSWLQT